MKKIFCVLCICLVVVGLFACSDNNAVNNSGELGLPVPGASATDNNKKEESSDNSDNKVITDNKTEVSKPEDVVKAESNNQKPADSSSSKPTDKVASNADTKVEYGDWNLILVNPWNKLPENFDVEMTKISGSHYIDSRAYSDYEAMMTAMKSEGLSPYVCSSYRTFNKQTTLYNNQVAKYISRGYTQASAEAEAGKWVAIPGTSEHHTGLALDIVASSYQVLDESQENTAEQKWLMNNSYKYGFILRYPEDKSDITGIYYEPWHYRYVGKEVAKEIFDSGVCLEEYLGIINN